MAKKPRKKKYVFDKWACQCPRCGKKLIVRTAHNTAWTACIDCGYEGPKSWTVKGAVKAFAAAGGVIKDLDADGNFVSESKDANFLDTL